MLLILFSNVSALYQPAGTTRLTTPKYPFHDVTDGVALRFEICISQENRLWPRNSAPA